MAQTFAQLNIPFPLFEGPSDQAAEYRGLSSCSLCDQRRQHCFELGIGCAVMVDCPRCGAWNGLDTDDRADGHCRKCKTKIPFPSVKDGEILACYACLRSGRAALTKDTELGMISWEQAFAGVTHGVPGLDRDDFEMVPQEDDWVGAKLPSEMMFEMLRTPTYSSIQGERWQFCCGRPMIFLGQWNRKEFTRQAADGKGRKLFDEIVQDTVPGLWEDKLHDATGVYVFRCPSCQRKKAHWDLA